MQQSTPIKISTPEILIDLIHSSINFTDLKAGIIMEIIICASF
jgi:hypothetical protein